MNVLKSIVITILLVMMLIVSFYLSYFLLIIGAIGLIFFGSLVYLDDEDNDDKFRMADGMSYKP